MSPALEVHLRLMQQLPVRTHIKKPPIHERSIHAPKKTTARTRTLRQTSKIRAKVKELRAKGLTNPQIGRKLNISRQLAYYLLK